MKYSFILLMLAASAFGCPEQAPNPELDDFHGPAGADGEPGPQGPQGVAGEVGPAGPQGPQGEVGPAGADGAPGVAGAQGPAGPQGESGPPGAPGAMGPQGPQGQQGPQGLQGAQGERGEAGPKGETGATGPAGPQGPQGPQGEQGPQGPRGLTGAVGERGAQGLNGFNGLDGAPGADGRDGVDGKDGADGLDGVDGETFALRTGVKDSCVLVETGVDVDGDLALQDSEVLHEESICLPPPTVVLPNGLVTGLGAFTQTLDQTLQTQEPCGDFECPTTTIPEYVFGSFSVTSTGQWFSLQVDVDQQCIFGAPGQDEGSFVGIDLYEDLQNNASLMGELQFHCPRIFIKGLPETVSVPNVNEPVSYFDATKNFNWHAATEFAALVEGRKHTTLNVFLPEGEYQLDLVQEGAESPHAVKMHNVVTAVLLNLGI